MPRLTRWFLRAAMVHLVAAITLGIVLALPGTGGLGGLTPVYIHLLVVGWSTQMIFGVAWWMFPRRTPDAERDAWLGWLCFATLNAGLLLRAVSEPAASGGMASVLLGAAAALQLVAVVAFVAHAWPRVFTR